MFFAFRSDCVAREEAASAALGGGWGVLLAGEEEEAGRRLVLGPDLGAATSDLPGATVRRFGAGGVGSFSSSCSPSSTSSVCGAAVLADDRLPELRAAFCADDLSAGVDFLEAESRDDVTDEVDNVCDDLRALAGLKSATNK